MAKTKSKARAAGMVTIDRKAAVYAEAMEALDLLVDDATRAIANVRAAYAGEIRELAQAADAAEAALKAEIERSRDLFKSPRTRTLHGVRLGVMTQKGAIVLNGDDEIVVARIRALLDEEQARCVIKVTEKPDKAAIGKLDEETLKRLAIERTGDVDTVYIRIATSDPRKAAQAFLEAGDAK